MTLSIQPRLLWLFVLQLLFAILPASQNVFVSAKSKMGVYNKIPCGLTEVDVIVAGGELFRVNPIPPHLFGAIRNVFTPQFPLISFYEAVHALKCNARWWSRQGNKRGAERALNFRLLSLRISYQSIPPLHLYQDTSCTTASTMTTTFIYSSTLQAHKA